MSGETLYRHIPSDYIAFLMMNGLLILFFTPIFFWVPSIPWGPWGTWVNPFSATGPTEALGSIAIVTILSLFVGFPGFLFRDKIVGRGGLNERIRGKVKEVKLYTPCKDTRIIESIKFHMWAKSAGVSGIVSFLVLKVAIVNGIIIGSEIAGVTNYIIIIITLLLRLKNLFITAYILFYVSLIIFLITWLYNKWGFEHEYDDIMKAIDFLYEKRTPLRILKLKLAK